jgi:hypothetical protein
MKQILEKAYEFLELGECKGSYARNPEGIPVDVKSEEATCFCSAGALMRAAKDEYTYNQALVYLNTYCVMRYLTIIRTNDNLPYEEVKAIWRKAIASCPR